MNSLDDIVSEDPKTKSVMTFGGVAKQLGLSKNLTVDYLNVQADHTLFERFDNFNNKYNPMAQPLLRTLMLKTDNYLSGRYFAEIINETFEEYAKDQYTYAENRVSIYGIKLTEWDKLAEWFDTHGMGSKHNKWIIQVPRVYKVFRSMNTINSFGQYIENIFKPLWEVSLEPHKNPRLHNFLMHVSGFDSVDNEATIDLPFVTSPPWQWTAVENPPYNYYMYHLWANIRTLNEFRASQGLSTFALRPHCGESGSDDHLVGAFLTADAINHGINLAHDPTLEYIYYLMQIGLAVSPLSNNALFLHYLKNPFPGMFRRGLNVSLSTDDPLMFHQTREPLVEEYSIAAKVWGFSTNDLCEIARNSALQSGFVDEWKRDRLGDRYFFSSSLGNDPMKTHLSDIRMAFRFETYHAEIAYLEGTAKDSNIPRAMFTAHQENHIIETELFEAGDIVCSTQNEEMERLIRDIEDQKKAIRDTRLGSEQMRRRTKSLAEQIGDVARKITVLESEERASKLPPPPPEIAYAARRRPSGVSSQVVFVPNQAKPDREAWRSFLRPPSDDDNDDDDDDGGGAGGGGDEPGRTADAFSMNSATNPMSMSMSQQSQPKRRGLTFTDETVSATEASPPPPERVRRPNTAGN
jgi:AMP deaminase